MRSLVAILVLVAASSLAIACEPGFAARPSGYGNQVGRGSATVGFWGGEEHWITSLDPTSRWEGHELDVVRDEASRTLGCAADAIELKRPYDRAFIASGCGKRTSLLLVYVPEPESRPIPGQEGLFWVRWARAVDLVAARNPPAIVASSHVDDPLALATQWLAIVAAGARDLACPPAQITPDYVPQGRAPDLPIAEGCGKRATYVSEREPRPLRLSAIVPMQ